MTRQTIPAGFHTITPQITVRDASAAIEFYKRAFYAIEVQRVLDDDGRVWFATLKIGDSHFFICDEFPELDYLGPQSRNGCTGYIHLYVDDVDTTFQRAIECGAILKDPAEDMFWGDRYGKVVDPFGQEWAIATHKEDLTPGQFEIKRVEYFQARRKASHYSAD